MNVQSILGAYPFEAFTTRDYGRRFLYIAGKPGGFSHLLTWSALNGLLDQLADDASRVYLLKQGRRLDVKKMGVFPNGVRTASSALTAQLRAGAVLVVEGIDQVHHPIRQLARSLERDTGTRVRINACVGFQFSTRIAHWDEDHSLHLQITGKSRWQIDGAVCGYPPSGRNSQTMSPPADAPLWENFLNDGDTLYVPRGWWYSGDTCGEPMIYLSIALKGVTGLDLLRWMANDLKEHASIRTEILRCAHEDAQVQYLTDFRAAVLEYINSPTLLRRFFAQEDAIAPIRPSFALPTCATTFIVMDSGGYIEVLAPRGLQVRCVNGEEAVEVYTGGIIARFDPAAVPLLDYLNHHNYVLVAEFMQAFNREFEAEQLREFLKALVDHGLITIKELDKPAL